MSAQPCRCAELQRQIDDLRGQVESLDRGVIEATTAVSDARRHIEAQNKAWAIWRDCADRLEPVPPGTFPQPRNGLYALPGGAA